MTKIEGPSGEKPENPTRTPRGSKYHHWGLLVQTVGVAGSDRIGNDFNLGLRVTGGLTFGPKPGVVDIRVVKLYIHTRIEGSKPHGNRCAIPLSSSFDCGDPK